MKAYSLRKSKKILIGVYHLWRKKRKRLLTAQDKEIQNDLRTLQEEVVKKNPDGANYMAHKCLDYGSGILKKNLFQQIRDFVLALVFALAIALLIRQVWFELYEIPTGSMRPTLKEKDRLIVSKTDFGINIPFTTKHVYFDPNLAKRSGIIVFTVANMDVRDPDTMYFWLFPGKKQFVKRLMGKPGDTVFFYGGQIYGIDKNGRDISEQLQLSSLKKIDHVPIMQFDGSVSLAEPFKTDIGHAYRMAIVHQMNEPVARLTAIGANRLEGELLHVPQIHDRNNPLPNDFWQMWGIGNYAKARIVRKIDTRSFGVKHDISLEEGKNYLELKHHPSLNHLELSKDRFGRLRPQFALSTSIIEIDDEHMKRIFETLYTARFVIKNGYAIGYSAAKARSAASHFLTRVEGVSDGTYEYYHGQAYQIKWGGAAIKLDSNHPLMRYNPDLARKFFNYGISFDKRHVASLNSDTSRFGYFRNGDLFLMGSAVFKQNEPVLEDFVAQERSSEQEANFSNRYIPFVDTGAPVDEKGSLDIDTIRKFGLRIPDKMYLSLGDNFAMSGDSRDYGFVPEGNLRGGPSYIFWPPGPRFGQPNQPSYPWLTLPNVIIWILGLTCLGFWFAFHRRHHTLPLKDL